MKTLYRYSFCDEIITCICWAGDFSNQKILSKMILDAYSQLFITARFRRRELIFCHLPSSIVYNKGYFHGYGKILKRYNSIHFFHICTLSVSKKVISLMYNIVWVGYLSFKLMSVY